jgi:hypothetical protein
MLISTTRPAPVGDGVGEQCGGDIASGQVLAHDPGPYDDG